MPKQFFTRHLHLLPELIDNTNDMIFIINMQTLLVEYVNQTVIDDTGYSFEEIRARGIEGIRHSLEGEITFNEHIDLLKAKKKMVDYAIIERKDGSRFTVEARLKLITLNGVDYNIAIVSDITERIEAQKILEASNDRLQLLVDMRTKALQEQSVMNENYKQVTDESSIVSRSTLGGKIIYVNDAFVEVSGFSREELIGSPHSIVRHPDTSKSVFKELWSTITSQHVWKGIIKNRKKDGGYYWVDMVIKPILDKDGKTLEYIAVRNDITELIDTRERLQTIAYTHMLTTLPNRTKLLEEIDTLDAPSIALLNVDGFSQINDFYGHHFGDALIAALAEKIKSYLHKHYTLFHLHIDEFLILADDEERTVFSNYIRFIIENLRNTPFTINNETLFVDISGSISFEQNDMLLSTADIALKHVKKSQDQLLIYTPQLEISNDFEKNLMWSHKLRSALAESRITPFFQPIVNNANGAYEKYEALVRLIDTDEKVYTPFHFLNAAHRSKQYRQLTQAVLTKTLETMKHHPGEFSINLSIDDLLDKDIQKYLFGLLDFSDLGNRLVIELLETEGINDFETVCRVIDKIKSYGCKISIDDFGTGYSNFSYLIKLQVDYVKIDGSIIQSLHERNSQILVETIVAFTKALGIKTIAEFVSERSIFERVTGLGIDYSQGYYFSEPTQTPYAQKLTSSVPSGYAPLYSR